MKRLTIGVKEIQVQGSAPLPQAELLKGATGYVLALQIGATGFAIDVLEVIKQIASGELKDEQTRTDNSRSPEVSQEG